MAHPKAPTHYDVRTARHKTGLNLAEAGLLVYVGGSVWQAWERDPSHRAHKSMHPAYAELFALKVGLKPLVVVPTKVINE